MAKVGGAALRIFETLLYAITFCCAGIILGFYSYFLSVLADRNLNIANTLKAVEGISGAAVLYLIFAVVLTCCLGGVRFFTFLAIILDILFAGGFIAIAVLTRDGVRSCTGDDVRTPLGRGDANSRDAFGSDGFGDDDDENVTYSVKLGTACNYNKACFAVAIIGAFLFLLSAIFQLWLGRHHQREKALVNNYDKASRGSKFKIFNRRKTKSKTTHAAHDAEKSHTLRPSHDAHRAENVSSYDSHGHATTAGGYHTHPTGASVSPYGYDNTRNAATNY